jgi:hypothetical protein
MERDPSAVLPIAEPKGCLAICRARMRTRDTKSPSLQMALRNLQEDLRHHQRVIPKPPARRRESYLFPLTVPLVSELRNQTWIYATRLEPIKVPILRLRVEISNPDFADIGDSCSPISGAPRKLVLAVPGLCKQAVNEMRLIGYTQPNYGFTQPLPAMMRN